MIPQGSTLLNLKVFESLKERAHAVNSCAALQALVDEAMPSINAELQGVTDQLAALQPILALLQPPSVNPAQIVTWITTFITAFLTPYVKPTVTYASQLTQYATEVAELAALIAVLSGKFTQCSVSLPQMPQLPQQPQSPV